MRRALNDNPLVQVVMLGILGIVVAFLFMTRVMSDGREAEAPAEVAPPTAAAPAEVPSAAPVPEPAPTVGLAGFEAGPGLPGGVVSAHEDGDVVVLLVMQEKGIEDRKLRADVERLGSRADTTVFVADAGDVARYSRIAEGVDLDRVPAIIVIHPRDGRGGSTAAGSLPTAAISYGFRGPEGVQQAVRDALYDGKRLPFHPG